MIKSAVMNLPLSIEVNEHMHIHAIRFVVGDDERWRAQFLNEYNEVVDAVTDDDYYSCVAKAGKRLEALSRAAWLSDD